MNTWLGVIVGTKNGKKINKKINRRQIEDLYSNVACITAWIASVSYTPKKNKTILIFIITN